MNSSHEELAARFRELHRPEAPLLLANAWDAGSARLIEACGATAIGTTSAGLAWSRGYPDGDALPPHALASAAAEIARAISLPLTIDIEGGYASDPQGIHIAVAAVLNAGAVGINLEDGTAPPELLAEKIGVARRVARAIGRDLFINARTDVYLRGLVSGDDALAETLARARRYRDAGADGLFVPGLGNAGDIRALVQQVQLPVNVMALPSLPPVSELRQLGVCRVSAGSAIAQAALACTRHTASTFLSEGRYEGLFAKTIEYGELNALYDRSR